MRFCENDTPEVHEATGATLAPLLREAADLVEGHDGYAYVTNGLSESAEYYVTVYLH